MSPDTVATKALYVGKLEWTVNFLIAKLQPVMLSLSFCTGVQNLDDSAIITVLPHGRAHMRTHAHRYAHIKTYHSTQEYI